jgi:hypothetical protein
MDYDPLLFIRFLHTIPSDDYYQFSPGTLVPAVRWAATPANEKRMEDEERMPEDELDGLDMRTRLLIRNSIVAHVRVDEMVMSIDSLAFFARDAVKVTATILDPIQGRRVPSCELPGTLKPGAVSDRYRGQPALPGTCLQFEYRTQWAGYRGTTNYITIDSVDWVHPGREYIVLLDFTQIGADWDQPYYMFSPTGIGWSVGMYPIIDGTVRDAKNDLGFGPQVPVDQFKARLREEIGIIRSQWKGYDCEAGTSLR